MLDAISVTPEGESNILAVTGKADDATEATQLANTFARESLEPPAATCIARQASRRGGAPEASQDDLGDDTEAAATVTERHQRAREGRGPTAIPP